MIATQRQIENSLRRAAILLSNLDAETRRRVLAHMPHAEATRLRTAAASLVDVDPLEVRRVVDSFVGRVNVEVGQQSLSSQGLAKKESENLTGKDLKLDSGGNAEQDGAAANTDQTLKFLSQVSDATLLHVVRAEHPQTVAIVLGALPSQQAARLLKSLPGEVRHAAIRRLGRLDEVPADVLSEIAEHLRTVIGSIEPQSGSGGRKTLAAILSQMDEGERTELVGDAAESDGLIAAALESVSRASKEKEASLGKERTEPEKIESKVENLDADENLLSISHWREMAATKASGGRLYAEEAASSSVRIAKDEIDEREMEDVNRLLESLKPRELRTLLARMESRQAILTLCGLSPGQVKKLMKHLPRRQVKEVQQRMSSIGALELREVDAAKLAAIRLLRGQQAGDHFQAARAA